MSKITYPDKVKGDDFKGTEATEVKNVVNTNDDEVVKLTGDQSILGVKSFRFMQIGGEAPSTATSPGAAGQVFYSSSFFYVCISANVWKRTPLTTW